MSVDPIRIAWTDKETGLGCEVVFVSGSHWCGYVDVPRGTPAFHDGDINVHGGVTYPSNGAYDPDTDDRVGFDCAHSGDRTAHSPYGRVWTEESVRLETVRLARQIFALSGGGLGALSRAADGEGE